MKFYPAIDLKAGQCVRLKQGRMDDATIYNLDPLAQAEAFARAGARRLHVVDLDGAFAGHSMNGAMIAQLVQQLDIPVQFGGGVRNIAAVEGWLGMGMAQVIIGSAAVEDPEFLRVAAQQFPDRIMLGLDTAEDEVMIKGWAEGSGLRVEDVLQHCQDLPLAGIVHTDIVRDGMKTGVNHQATEALARRTLIPVIASGGLGSMQDVSTLLACPSIAGVISGRALYDGSIDLAEVLTVME
ncbi:MAG: 1-(5-phosphoribosyl)-5-[(5-phosphoribosylamino)methylideneamino]imidazole-4-carboxamide isomerase [Alphaproteobacteria bacterium]|nr:1-(5-phosphoribosyl)-5-[(5-phosphoribosylamino)methylideneamino]imidazole-4-carboxamide isomerase [Alphaproteobacteria bacterium]